MAPPMPSRSSTAPASRLAVNTPDQKVEWESVPVADLTALRVGTVDQTLLQPAGDDTRIDWGHLYVAAPAGSHGCGRGAGRPLHEVCGPGNDCRRRTTLACRVPPLTAQPVLAIRILSGQVDAKPVLVTSSSPTTRSMRSSSSVKNCDLTGGEMARPRRTCCRPPSGITPVLFDDVSVRHRAHGRPDPGRGERYARMRRSPIARRWRAAGWRPMPTSSRSSSPRRIAATAASPRST